MVSSVTQPATRRRVTYTQLLHLWEYLNSHREIAVGYNKTTQSREHSKRKWQEVALALNSLGEGATKTGQEWSKYWVDYKSKIKKRHQLINDARRGTGGGPSTEEEPNEIESRFINLLRAAQDPLDRNSGQRDAPTTSLSSGSETEETIPAIHVDPFPAAQDPLYQSSGQRDAPNNSQPSASEEAIYLEVDYNNEPLSPMVFLTPTSHSTASHPIQTPQDQPPSTSRLPQPHPIQPPQDQTSSTSRLSRSHPVQPSQDKPSSTSRLSHLHPVQPPQDQPSTSNPRRRLRRLRRRPHLTAAEARDRLVSFSRIRAEAELANSRYMERGVRCLEDMVAILRRIEERY